MDTLQIALEKCKDAVLKNKLTDEFGELIDEITLVKTGKENEAITFIYVEDWTIPEGYTFVSFHDEQIAKQDVVVKYGETLDTFTAAIVPETAK